MKQSLPFSLKAVAGSDPNGEFLAVLSTPDVDREGESVAAGAFEPLPASIPVFRSHGWTRAEDPIGVGVPAYEGSRLMLRGRWAPTPEAQTTRALVEGGFITSMSAGFITKQRDPSNPRVILKGELLEGSTAPIPVQPAALILAAKALTSTRLKAGARNSAADLQLIQAMHDMATALGAMCPGEDPLIEEKALDADLRARVRMIDEAVDAVDGDLALRARALQMLAFSALGEAPDKRKGRR